MQTSHKNLLPLLLMGGLSQGLSLAAHAQTLPPPAQSPQAKPSPAPARRSAPAELPAPARPNADAGKAPSGERPAVPGEQPLYFPPDEGPIEMEPKAIPTPRPRPTQPATPKGTPKPKGTPTPKATTRPAPRPMPKKPRPVSIGGISINGLNDLQVIAKLRQSLSDELHDTVTLWDGTEKHLVARDALGASIPYYALLAEARRQSSGQGPAVNIPLYFRVDEKRAQNAVKALAKKINHSVEKASLDVEDGVAVVRGGDGVEVAVVGSAQRIARALTTQPPQSYVELVVKRTVNGTSSNTLKQFRYLLASFSTPYDSGIRGRTNNLRMAAHEVDGTIVQPGKIFSTNQAIGPRNAAAGWREAKMFVNGQIVSGTGAGICQCSTTIYNAALLAGLPIVERYPHSFRVTYAPASRDAAIAWGSKDFRFRNNTGGPIYVQTFLKGERFHVRLYGTKPAPRGIEVQSRVISSGNGTRSEAYRLTPTATGVTKERLSRDYYKPHP